MSTVIDMVHSHNSAFPWTKFQRLWRLPEIFDAQVEDGYPPPDQIEWLDMARPNEHIWLAMQGSRALGFVVNQLHGAYWGEIHASFRNGVPGLIKKHAAVYCLTHSFEVMGMIKMSAFIARYNRPARFLAREVGMTPEGVISKSFLRNGQHVDRLVYGVTRDEFSVRFSPECI